MNYFWMFAAFSTRPDCHRS